MRSPPCRCRGPALLAEDVYDVIIESANNHIVIVLCSCKYNLDHLIVLSVSSAPVSDGEEYPFHDRRKTLEEDAENFGRMIISNSESE